EDQPLGDDAREPDGEDGQPERCEVVEAEERVDVVRDVPAEHVELAVGEVDDLEDREDEREAEGDQDVDHRQAEAVEQRLDQQLERRGRPLARLIRGGRDGAGGGGGGPAAGRGWGGPPRPVRGWKSRAGGGGVRGRAGWGGPGDGPRPPRAKSLMNSPGD